MYFYLIVLKPLLLFFNYGEIRTINMIVQFFLLTAVLMGMAKKRFTPYILPFMASYLYYARGGVLSFAI